MQDGPPMGTPWRPAIDPWSVDLKPSSGPQQAHATATCAPSAIAPQPQQSAHPMHAGAAVQHAAAWASPTSAAHASYTLPWAPDHLQGYNPQQQAWAGNRDTHSGGHGQPPHSVQGEESWPAWGTAAAHPQQSIQGGSSVPGWGTSAPHLHQRPLDQPPTEQYSNAPIYASPAGQYSSVPMYAPPAGQYSSAPMYAPPAGQYNSDPMYAPSAGQYSSAPVYAPPAPPWNLGHPYCYPSHPVSSSHATANQGSLPAQLSSQHLLQPQQSWAPAAYGAPPAAVYGHPPHPPLPQAHPEQLPPGHQRGGLSPLNVPGHGWRGGHAPMAGHPLATSSPQNPQKPDLDPGGPSADEYDPWKDSGSIPAEPLHAALVPQNETSNAGHMQQQTCSAVPAAGPHAGPTHGGSGSASGAPPAAKRMRPAVEPALMPASRKAVFVWDLDETLIIFNSLLNGKFLLPGGGQEEREFGTRAAAAWADVLFDVLDNSFRFPAVEDTDPMHLGDVLRADNEPQRHARGATGWQGHLEQGSERDGPASTGSGEQVCSVEQGGSTSRDGAEPQPQQGGRTSRGGAAPQLQQAGSASWGGAVSKLDDSVDNGHERPGVAPRESLPSSSAGASGLGRDQVDVFRAGRDLYVEGLPALRARLSAGNLTRMDESWRKLEELTGSWASMAAGLLRSTALRGLPLREDGVEWDVRHCIVSRGQLLATLAKLMLFGFSDSVSWQDVYSASKDTKLACFQRIAQSHGPDCRFVAAGDAPEELRAADSMGWAFLKIDPKPTSVVGAIASGQVEHTAPVAAGYSVPSSGFKQAAGMDLGDWAERGCSIHELDAGRLLSLLKHAM